MLVTPLLRLLHSGLALFHSLLPRRRLVGRKQKDQRNHLSVRFHRG